MCNQTFFDVHYAGHQVECEQQKAVLAISTHDEVVIMSEQRRFTIQLKFVFH